MTNKSYMPHAIGLTVGLIGAVISLITVTSRQNLENIVDETPTAVEDTIKQTARTSYIIQPGDTAYKICQEKHVSFTELQKYNPNVQDWNTLIVGQEIYVK